MTILPMYPLITVTRQDNQYLIASPTKTVTLTDESDMFFENTSLRTLFAEEVEHQFTINHDNWLYKYCNALVSDGVEIHYVIYDCEFDRWLCLTEDGDVEWTTQYDDKDITRFDSEEEAEDMVYDETDGYGIHTRYYMKE